MIVAPEGITLLTNMMGKVPWGRKAAGATGEGDGAKRGRSEKRNGEGDEDKRGRSEKKGRTFPAKTQTTPWHI